MDYHFKLEALRQYRNFQEESQQKEMAEAQRVRDQEATGLAELIARRDQTVEALRLQQENCTTGPNLAIYHDYLNQLASDIFAQKFKVSDAEKKLTKKREALLLAIQKRKALDKLKAKGQKAHTEHLNSEEEKFINEMAINRYSAKNR